LIIKQFLENENYYLQINNLFLVFCCSRKKWLGGAEYLNFQAGFWPDLEHSRIISGNLHINIAQKLK